jgi:hypothetical protein
VLVFTVVPLSFILKLQLNSRFGLLLRAERCSHLPACELPPAVWLGGIFMSVVTQNVAILADT